MKAVKLIMDLRVVPIGVGVHGVIKLRELGLALASGFAIFSRQLAGVSAPAAGGQSGDGLREERPRPGASTDQALLG